MDKPEPKWDCRANLCPFCGDNELTLCVREYKFFIKGWLKCGHCNAQGPEARELKSLISKPNDLKDKIVELWNHATPPK